MTTGAGAPLPTGARAGGLAPPGPPRAWGRWLIAQLTSYLPLLLMLLLALGTWWLVKNSPLPPGPAGENTVRSEPDYSMTGFAVERFDAQGQLILRLEGAVMHHYPATDRIEIETVRIRAISPQGRVTLAHAQRALATGDGSEVQLLGGAEVTSSDAEGTPLVMRSEFLHAFFVTERVLSNRPVVVVHGGTEVRAAGLSYDHPSQKLELTGPTRLTLPPRGRTR